MPWWSYILIAVSHLHKLEEHFHNSEVKILHAGEDHKII